MGSLRRAFCYLCTLYVLSVSSITLGSSVPWTLQIVALLPLSTPGFEGTGSMIKARVEQAVAQVNSNPSLLPNRTVQVLVRDSGTTTLDTAKIVSKEMRAYPSSLLAFVGPYHSDDVEAALVTTQTEGQSSAGASPVVSFGAAAGIVI